MEKMRFEGKVVIVTGASSGIGRSTARLFAMAVSYTHLTLPTILLV